MHKHSLCVLGTQVGNLLEEVHVASKTPAPGPIRVSFGTAPHQLSPLSILPLSADEETEAQARPANSSVGPIANKNVCHLFKKYAVFQDMNNGTLTELRAL